MASAIASQTVAKLSYTVFFLRRARSRDYGSVILIFETSADLAVARELVRARSLDREGTR